MSRFGYDFQVKLLCAAAADPEFFAYCDSNMHLDDFSDVAVRFVFEVVRDHFRRLKSMPTTNTLPDEIADALDAAEGHYDTHVAVSDESAVADVLEKVTSAIAAGSKADTPYFRDKMRPFLASVRLGGLDGENMTEEEQLAAAEEISRSLKALDQPSEEEVFSDAFDETPEEIPGQTIRVGTGVFGIDINTNMGIKPGQLAMLVAPSGVGKTTGMINFAISNAMRGLRSLFITLENPKEMIQDRLQSIMGNIDITLFKKRRESWPIDARKRLAFILRKDFPYRGFITVADMSKKGQTCDDIESLIAKWRERCIKGGCDAMHAPVVYVDWLEKILPDGVPNINRNSNSDLILKAVLEYLGEIARRNGVAIWTAQQVTRDAQDAEVLERKHIAHSSHALDPLDVCIGLTVSKKGQGGLKIVNVVADADVREPPKLDRTMNVSFLKTRESNPTSFISFYQGPSLKFWTSKEYAQRVERVSRDLDFEAMYGMMAPLDRERKGG